MADEGLTIEKLKLHERLSEVRTDLNILIELKKRDHEDMKTLLMRHDVTLHGNGKPGLVDQVRDHANLLGMAKWVIILGGGLVITDLAKFFLSLYRGQP